METCSSVFIEPKGLMIKFIFLLLSFISLLMADSIQEEYQQLDKQVSFIRTELRKEKLVPQELNLFHSRIKQILYQTEEKILELEAFLPDQDSEEELLLTKQQLRLFQNLHKRTTSTIHLINERTFKVKLSYISQASPPLYHFNTYKELIRSWEWKPFLTTTEEKWTTLGFAILLIVAWCLFRKIGPLLALLCIKGWINILDFSGTIPLIADLILGLGIALYITLLLSKDEVTLHFILYRWASNILVWITPVLLFIGYANASLYLFYGWLGTTAIYLSLHRVNAFLADRVHQLLLSFKLSLADKGMQILEYWGKVLVAFILSLIGLLGILLVWRVSYTAVADWTYMILFGIEIGTYEFSLMKLFMAIIAFFALFSFTRYLQRFLDQRVFAYTYVDKGVSHAIKTAAGYLGLVIAVLFALNIVGIKFSNIMYILGGLSVGIGLGLQPVVTNFISGLIMLIERPIRIGDFVDLPDAKGVVTRINVRTTKIRTKDRCTVLIPNNQLINSTLRNWTHENRQKRIDIGVGVGYENDPVRVREVLLEVVKKVEKVSMKPAPQVELIDFAPSTMEFMVLVYVDNFEDATETGSQCRFAIKAALKEHNISTPYPRMEIFVQQET